MLVREASIFQSRDSACDETLAKADHTAVQIEILPFQAESRGAPCAQLPSNLQRKPFAGVEQLQQCQVFSWRQESRFSFFRVEPSDR